MGHRILGELSMRYSLCVLLLAAATLHAPEQPAEAAEAATGVYLLGSRSVGAGITPPPGLYFNDDTYFYSGKIGGGRPLPLGGLLVANVSAQTWINLPTTIWVTPAKILGGDLAFSVTTPFGEPRVNANLLINSPRFGPNGGHSGFLHRGRPAYDRHQQPGCSSEANQGKVVTGAAEP
jgi:hypothetical protein